MDYLPIIVKKGRPFLEALSSALSKERAVCPRGKLVAFLDGWGRLRVHLLSDDGQHTAHDSGQFVGLQWVEPCESNQVQECMVDVHQQQRSELLAVATNCDLHWYSVSEQGGDSGAEERERDKLQGPPLLMEGLAVMRKVDLSAELRRLEQADVVTTLKPLGSANGKVLLLVNGTLACWMGLDREFSRLTLHSCLQVDPHLWFMRDEALPVRVGPMVDCLFLSSLLLTLCENGIVFVYNVESGVCIGVINPIEYCKMASARQPESEELLANISVAHFRHITASPDLAQLAVSTHDNHLLLVSLPDYFQTFPSHYHPQFLNVFTKKQKAAKSRAQEFDVVDEEEEDRKRYGGLTSSHYEERFLGPYSGYYPWRNRMGQLKTSVDAFFPSEGHYLNFRHNSQVSEAPSTTLSGEHEWRTDLREVHTSKKAWFEEPISYSLNEGSMGWRDIIPLNFDLQFVTGLTKQVRTSTPYSLTAGSDSPARAAYKTHCILPPATGLLDPESAVFHLTFSSGVVVAYYGRGRGQVRGREGVSPSPIDQQPVTGIAVYRTDVQAYSATRLHHPSWLVLPCKPDQPVYLVCEQSLAVATFNLSQEEFVSKVLMYGSASVAEKVCHLNRWDRCSLPINALESALELRQLDTVAFFLRTRDHDPGEGDKDKGPLLDTRLDLPSLPPLPPAQLDTAVQLLIQTIQKNHQEEHYCQFASQLLIMTLAFLTRLIKSYALAEELGDSPSERAESEQGGEEVELTAGSGEVPLPSSPNKRRRTFSGTSDTFSLGSMGGASLQETSVSLATLTSYVQILRGFLPNAILIVGGGKRGKEEEEGVEGKSEGGGGVMEFVDHGIAESWNKMKPKEVVKDALLRGCLPLAQAYLLHRKPSESDYGHKMESVPQGVSLAEALDDYPSSPPHHHDASLSFLLTLGIGFVLEALEKRSIKLATLFLLQMGLDVRQSLRHVCFHTLNRGLRDFLAEELVSQQWLSEGELQTLEYLRVLETYYPLSSYDLAINTHSKNLPRKMAFQSTVLPVVPGLISRLTPIPTLGNLQDIFPETFGGDRALSWEALPSSPSSSSSSSPSPPGPTGPSLYLQVPLCAVLHWDTPTRQRMLFEGFVLTGQTEGAECEHLVNKEHIFNYYIGHTNIQSALQFVTSRVPPLENPAPCPTHILSLCSNMPLATRYLRDSLLDELTRNGVLLPSELSNLSHLLHRVGRVHSLLSHPHPLTKTSGHMTSQEVGGAIVSLESFHSGFLKYLIEKRFVGLMYHYLDCYQLALDEASISSLGLETSEHPWVDTLLQYRMAALNPADPNAVFQASLSCSHLLLGEEGGGRTTSVMGMLRSGKTLMAIATLMFAPLPLEEAMDPSNVHREWYVDQSSLRQATAPYPTLQAAIFPPPPTTLTPAQSQDITVYQLLQGSVPFNISHLFKWQETNRLAAQDEATEGTSEIPHFSSSSLAEKYALTEHLTYTYYLQRGQPSFAFANFVAAKLLSHSNTAKRIDRAVSRVYQMALLDFTNSKLASSCAAFVEMMDRDSTLLRVDTQAALRIARHGQAQTQGSPTNKPSEGVHKHRKIAAQFIQLHSSPDNLPLSSSLLSQLELATHNLLSSAGIDRCGLEAEECWSLVQSFCHCHQLPPSVAFLTTCAREGHWLPLLCHAQLYAVPPHNVLTIVDKHFADPCIQEHLRLAISSMESSELPTSPTSPRAVGTPEKQRVRRKRIPSVRSRRAESLVRTQPDLRAKFYSKVGLAREPSSQREPKPPSVSSPPVSPIGTATTTGTGRREGSVPRELQRGTPEREAAVAIEETDLPGDIFSVLFKCQGHKSPWRALLAHSIALQSPLLAILAACYEQSCMVDCVCVWLYSTLGCSQLEKASTILGISGEGLLGEDLRFSANLQWRHWSIQDLAILLVAAMQHRPSPAAQFTLAFQYFDQKNPLLGFLRFHEEFLLRSNFDECWRHLQEFELNMDRCSLIGYTGAIGDVCWVEQLASTMVSRMLAVCPTPFERSHLLRLLAEANFGEGFQCYVLNFKDLHQMSEVLNSAGLASDAAFTVSEQFSPSPGAKVLPEVYSVRVRVDTDYVLGLLLEKEQFDLARKYASIVGSTASEVTIKEVEHNLKKLSKSSYWQYEQARTNFWHQCNSAFETEQVDPESAAEFFESIVHGYSDEESPKDPSEGRPHGYISAMERALLLAFALKRRKETDTLSADQLKAFEKEIWLSHIHATVEEMETSGVKPHSSPLPFLPSMDQQTTSFILHAQDSFSLLSTLSISAITEFKGRRRLSELLLPDNSSVVLEGKTSFSEKESEAFDMMLGRLLNAGFVSQARELAALFEHDSPDLTIVLCCIQLAQGKLTPDQLTPGLLSLVSTRSPRPLTDPPHIFEEGGDSRPSVEIIRLMHKLSDRAIYAQQCCSCVITCFKMAVALRTSYALVITSDPFDILTQLLSSRFPDKYALAKKFVTTCNLESKEVAGYLSECVAASLQSQQDSRDSPKTRVYDTQMSSNQFMELAQLCPDHAVLGGHLLSMARALSSTEHPTAQSLSIQVELLIRAHDCYTLGCCVDGIAEVLVVTRQWAETLASGRHFKLMVRMLTGIGRFHEMSYIIGYLLDHDEFESLVHPGVEKEVQLRVALMDYLRKHCSEDHEKMQMVALKFGMFRELAKTQEEQAKRDLRRIRSKHLVANNPETVKTLKNVFDAFRTAAKTYAQEDCLANAEYCYSQARLVALQLSVLQSGKQVINLDVKRVHKYMEEQPFSESLIVADAYKQCIWTDWVGPLYKKVVIAGDFRYLSDFKSAFQLTLTMFQELVSKYLTNYMYLHDRDKPPEAATNMKKLLGHLRNLPLKRKLATELGLTEVLHSLSPNFDEGFLNDVARL